MIQPELSEQIKSLAKLGYCKIESFVDQETVKTLRNLALSSEFQRDNGVIQGDVITYKAFREHIFNKKLLKILHQLIGKKLVYVCDGSVRGDDKVNSKLARKFHSDSRADDFNFDKEYPIYRFGIYLQDMDKYSGGLKIRKKSHERLCVDHGSFYEGFYRFVKYVIKYKKFPLLNLSTGYNIKAKAGDLLIWNMRLHHSGHAVRPKYFSSLSLPPFIENILPEKWRLPLPDKRCVIFFAFGLESKYTSDYGFYVKDHPSNIAHFQVSNFLDESLQEFKKDNNITFISEYFDDESIYQEYASQKFF